jgi:hypothetical protein
MNRFTFGFMGLSTGIGPAIGTYQYVYLIYMYYQDSQYHGKRIWCDSFPFDSRVDTEKELNLRYSKHMI